MVDGLLCGCQFTIQFNSTQFVDIVGGDTGPATKHTRVRRVPCCTWVPYVSCVQNIGRYAFDEAQEIDHNYRETRTRTHARKHARTRAKTARAADNNPAHKND